MNTALKVSILGAFVIGTGITVYLSHQDTKKEKLQLQQQNEVIELSGLISLDVEDFLNDSRVIQILNENKIKLKLKKVGSRDMPNQVIDNSYDFAFPSGIVAGNKIQDTLKKAKLDFSASNVYYSPMIIGSYQDTSDILVKNKLAVNTTPMVYEVDMSKLIPLMKEKKKWADLQFNQAYNFNKSILVYTTDVRKSNSSAMYLALASYIENNSEVITDNVTAEKVASTVADLYKRQGYQENFVSGNFDDYKQGAGKSPLAFIYEFQMYRYAVTNKKLKQGMTVMYPSPTITNKEVFISLKPNAQKLLDLLTNNQKLQHIAAEYGFRTNSNIDEFVKIAKENGLVLQADVRNQIDPPSFEIMNTMINTISAQLN